MLKPRKRKQPVEYPEDGPLGLLSQFKESINLKSTKN
jgi:hypothetical protein